jgi:hypothetical protein
MSRRTLQLAWRFFGGLALLGGRLSAVDGFELRADDTPPNPAKPKAAVPQPAIKRPATSAAQSIDLSNFLPDDQISNAQAGKPIEIKGLGTFTLNELATAAALEKQEFTRGRLVEIQGNPLVVSGSLLVTARVTSLCRGAACVLRGSSTPADARGRFLVIPGPEKFEANRLTPIEVRLATGQFETRFIPVEKQIVDVHLPTHLHPRVAPPGDVADEDLAGLVVDEQGNPLEGVEVALFEGMDGKNHRLTDKGGRFSFKNLAADFDRAQPHIAEVRFRKPGFSPERFMNQPLGIKGWVVALGSKTFIEGTVRNPDGKPARKASIRANQGPKQNVQGVFPDLRTETATDEAGRYRLYLQPDEYEILVSSPVGGVARVPKQTVAFGQQRTVDIELKPGVTFAAAVIDAQTNKPVANVRFWNWQHPGVEGRSDANGHVAIPAMFAGPFEFAIEAEGYVRWWSDSAKSEWCKKQIDNAKLSWQRNFDDVDFDLQVGMKPVTVVVERGVRVRGRVVDPTGKPVAGATVAPALTGSGNSLTGDTRYSVETKADGTFDMLLPASHRAKYNLIAHDGKYEEWRHWANAVLPPIQTTPGQQIEGVELKLTRPAVVRGRLVDSAGRAVVNCAIGLDATDKQDNRYYAPPAANTNSEGRFEIRFLRPGDYEIQTKWVHTADGLMTRQWESRKHPLITVHEGQDLEGIMVEATRLSLR